MSQTIETIGQLPPAIAPSSTDLFPVTQGFTSSGTGFTRAMTSQQLKGFIYKLGFINVADFGAIGDGVTDNTTAINTALASGLPVYLPPGNYITHGLHTISHSGQVVFGSGQTNTTITCTTAANPIFTVGSGSLNNIGFSGFTLSRSVTATSGGDGIQFPNVTGTSYVENVFITKQWRGLLLGATDYSWIRDCWVTNCQDNGICLINTGTNGTLQWGMINVLSQENVQSGFAIIAISGSSGITLGTWTNCTTFANGGYGLTAVGIPSCPISGVRLTGCFFGSDGVGGINMQTFGAAHNIHNTFVELAGTGATGPNLTIAAKNIGFGIYFDATNIDALVTGCKINNCSASGIITNSREITISGCNITQNGAAAIAGDQYGVIIQSGSPTITGCRIGNVLGGSSNQLYGIVCNVSSDLVISGNDLSNNAIASMFFNSTPSRVIIGNKGFTTQNHGQTSIGSGATTATVTHGLPITPAAEAIFLTPLSGLGSASQYWVSALGATTFQVNLDVAPGGTVTFGWSARIFGQ